MWHKLSQTIIYEWWKNSIAMLVSTGAKKVAFRKTRIQHGWFHETRNIGGCIASNHEPTSTEPTGDSNDPKKGGKWKVGVTKTLETLPIKNGKFTRKTCGRSNNTEPQLPSVHGNLKLRKWRNTERLGKRKKRRWTVDGRVDPSCKRLAFHAIHFMPWESLDLQSFIATNSCPVVSPSPRPVADAVDHLGRRHATGSVEAWQKYLEDLGEFWR